MQSLDILGLVVASLLIVVGAAIVIGSRPGSTTARVRGNDTAQMRLLGLGQLALGVSQLGGNLEGVVIPSAWHGWTAPAWITLTLAAIALLAASAYQLHKRRRG